MWESDWDILGVGKSSMNGGMGETPKIPHGYANLVNGPFITLYPITVELEGPLLQKFGKIGCGWPLLGSEDAR